MTSISAKIQNQRSRWPVVVCAIVFLALFTSHCVLIFDRLYDPDEFEHLHASLCLAQGQTAYRDFFEHHGPLPYMLAAPLAKWIGGELALFTALRFVSFGFTIVTHAAVFLLARQMYGKRAGVVAILFLESWPWFLEKSLEWRPDVLAMCFLIWAAWFVARSGVSPLRRGLPAGILIGLASLCTLKIVFVVIGIFVGALLMQRARKARWKSQIAAAVMGATLPLFGFGIYFWRANALSEFLYHVFWLPIIWKEREPLHDYCFSFQEWSPIHLGIGAAAILWSLARLLRRVPRGRGEPMLAIAVTLHFAAIPWLKAVFLQYYLLALPFAAVLSSGLIIRLYAMRRFASRKLDVLRFAEPILAIATVSYVVGAWMQKLPLQDCFEALRHYYETNSREEFDKLQRAVRCYTTVDLLALFAITIGLIIWPIVGRALGALMSLIFSRPASRRIEGIVAGFAKCLLWIAVAAPTINRLGILHFEWRNDGQIQDLRFIGELVRPNETVLDGFSGLGSLRPHAIYWWWLNPHSIPLMYEREGIAYLQAAVADHPPAAIVFDGYLDQYLRNHFAMIIVQKYRIVDHKLRSSNGILYIREDLADRIKTRDFPGADNNR